MLDIPQLEVVARSQAEEAEHLAHHRRLRRQLRPHGSGLRTRVARGLAGAAQRLDPDAPSDPTTPSDPPVGATGSRQAA